MAYRITNTTSGLSRTTDITPYSSDFTCLFKVRFNSSTDGGKIRFLFGILDTASGSYTDFVRLATLSGLTNGRLVAFNGTTTSSGINSIGVNSVASIAYVRRGDTHWFYEVFANVNTIGSFTKVMTGSTAARIVLGNDFTSLVETDCDLLFYREWSRALSTNEILQEAQSSEAISTTDLIADTPFVADTNDISGNGNDWTQVGVAGTFVTDIPSPVVDITGEALPYTRVVTVAEFNVANEFVFQLDVTTQARYGFATDVAHFPDILLTVFQADGIAVNRPLFNLAQLSGAVTLGPGTYFIRISSAAPIATDVTFEANGITTAPTVDAGDFIINDDNPGLPASVFDSTGALVGFIPTIPAGELGAALPDGTTIWHDRYLSYQQSPLVILDPSFAFVASVDTTPGLAALGKNPACITSNATNFYVLNVADTIVYRVTAAGTITSIATITVVTGAPTAIGVDNDETILYWAEGANAPYTIHAWDLINDVPLADLYATGIASGSLGRTALAANHNNNVILVLADGSVVVNAENLDTTPDTSVIYHVSAAGVLLNAISFDFTDPFGLINHYSAIDATTIRIWFFDSTGDNGRFAILNLTTGALSSVVDYPMFVAGQTASNTDNTPLAPSNSCAMVSYLVGDTPAETGTLRVIKVVVPSSDASEFDFVAGGLTPGTFTLGHGDMQTYVDLAPGSGYSVEETPVEGYTTVYVVSNGSPITALEVVANETTTVTVTNTSTGQLGVLERFPIRRYRRTPTLYDENQRIYIPYIEIDAQVGVGNSAGDEEDTNPELLVRASRDGGYTWGHERRIPLGKIGTYQTRVRENRWGVGRKWVFEIVDTAAVNVVLMNMYMTVEKGR